MGQHRLLANKWTENNVPLTQAYLEEDYKWNYITTYIALGVLVHSFYLHRFRYDSTRVRTDLACVLAIIPSITSAIASKDPTPLKSVIIREVINFAICGALIKICDFSLFFSRYIAIQKVTAPQRRVHYAIWAILWGALVTPVTIAPISVDITSSGFQLIYMCILGIIVIIGIGYILYFTFMSCKFIYKLVTWEKFRDSQVLPSQSDGISSASATAQQNKSTTIADFVIFCCCLHHSVKKVSAAIADDPMILNIPEHDEDDLEDGPDLDDYDEDDETEDQFPDTDEEDPTFDLDDLGEENYEDDLDTLEDHDGNSDDPE